MMWFFFFLHLNPGFLIRYKIKLDSDAAQYGGHGRLNHNTEFFTEPQPLNGRSNSMQVNISFDMSEVIFCLVPHMKCTLIIYLFILGGGCIYPPAKSRAIVVKSSPCRLLL